MPAKKKIRALRSANSGFLPKRAGNALAMNFKDEIRSDMAIQQNDESAEVAYMATLRQTFAEEAAELLEACEETLLRLESEADRSLLLADIFRAYHTVKGSASAIGCKDLAAFAHVAEDCLAEYRKNPERVTTQSIEVLLRVNDALRKRLITVTDAPEHDASWTEVRTPLESELAGLLDASTRPDNGVSQELPKTPAPEAPVVDRPAAAVSAATASKATSLALKIDASRVDAVMDMVGELVVIKSQIMEGLGKAHIDVRLRTLVGQLDKSVRELHERTLAMRMISLKSIFIKLERAVKDVATKLEKSVSFVVRGEDTEIDRAMVEKITDPLLHLCRNAVDHGIELPKNRTAQGKPAAGTIRLEAFRKGESVLIEIADDGRGIDKTRVLAKARTKGLLPAGTDDRLSDKEIFALLFHPGFSTAEKVTDISGRGVGLDVVKSNLSAIGGSIEIESTYEQGTLFRLCLPLTTAITDGIVVAVGDCQYILPLDCVHSFCETSGVSLLKADGAGQLARIKDAHYPFVRLGDFTGAEQGDQGLIILIEAHGRRFALLVDRVIGKTQVVLKPIGLGGEAKEGLGGAAVMGDGKVALIIDVLGLAELVEKSGTTLASAHRQPMEIRVGEA